jgi:hypothetical protein
MAIKFTPTRQGDAKPRRVDGVVKKPIGDTFEREGVEFIEGGARLKPKPSRKK